MAGPLLFLLYINDLSKATDMFTILFADDTTFQISSENEDFVHFKVNLELQKASDWFSAISSGSHWSIYSQAQGRGRGGV